MLFQSPSNSQQGGLYNYSCIEHVSALSLITVCQITLNSLCQTFENMVYKFI